ncbi:MAG: alpha/beta hydrolase [Geminicoccaceae bacterium]
MDVKSMALRALRPKRPADRVYPFRGTAQVTETRLRLPDGRHVGVARAGPPSAEPVVYLHGILGSRLEAFVGGEPRHGVIGIDRPGYGLSDPLTRPSLAAYGRDVEAVLDALGIERCCLFGVSAGAPYTLAAAVRLGSRVRELFLVAGVAHAGLVRTAGLPMRLLVDFAEQPVLREKVVPNLRELISRPLVANGWLRMTLTAERELLPSTAVMQFLARRLARSMVAGNAHGPEGVQTDLRLLTTPWDIDHRALACPVRIVHGLSDGVVAPNHGRWYARHLPGARLKLLPRYRHVSTILFTGPKVVAMTRCLERRGRPAG